MLTWNDTLWGEDHGKQCNHEKTARNVAQENCSRTQEGGRRESGPGMDEESAVKDGSTEPKSYFGQYGEVRHMFVSVFSGRHMKN